MVNRRLSSLKRLLDSLFVVYNDYMTEQIDQALSLVQKRRTEVQNSEDPDILTDRRPTREDKDVFRSPTNRYMRGSLRGLFERIKNDPQMRIGLLPQLRAESKKLTRGLDKLDTQFYKNVKTVTVELKPGEKQEMNVVELDLREPSEEPDTRIPWFIIGGAQSTAENDATISMGLALMGERVFKATYPEHMQEHAGTRSAWSRKDNTYGDEVRAFSQVISDLNIPELNLMGHSLGGCLVLDLASKSLQGVKLQDVVALSPSGFQRRFIWGIGQDFDKEGIRTHNDPEAKTLVFEQGSIDAKHPVSLPKRTGFERVKKLKGAYDFLGVGRAAASHVIKPETIRKAAANALGAVEIWTGDDDLVIREEPIIKTLVKAGNLPNVFNYVVDGGKHNSFIVHALGFLRNRALEKESRSGIYSSKNGVAKHVGIDTMERSGAEWILQQMKARKASSSPAGSTL